MPERVVVGTGSPVRTAGVTQPLLCVRDLRVGFKVDRSRREVVKGISFDVHPGRCLAIVGESGSGKSVTARSLVGLTGRNATVSATSLELRGTDLRDAGERRWRAIRGKEIGFVLQDALVSLDPVRPVGKEIYEALRLHGAGDRDTRRRRVIELLAEVGVPEPELRARQRPDELSGGLRQRALLASALALDPALLIADEPTTALDATVQAQVLALMERLKEQGRTLILISHDLGVVARLADQVAVMRAGEIVELGEPQEIFTSPRHDYTRSLLAAIPSHRSKGQRLSEPGPRELHAPGSSHRAAAAVAPGSAVIEARGLVKRYPKPDGGTRTVVDEVSFQVPAGKTLGVVGESGSGKTTTARLVLGLLDPDAGEVILEGRSWSLLSERERRPLRRRISCVYQDPFSSFDPRWTVRRIITEGLSGGKHSTREAKRRRAGELVDLVGLERSLLDRHVLTMSGGQRQRVAIARALAPDPTVIVCDEPVSALDVSIQAQILDLLQDLQDELGTSYLFISHDLGVIHHMSDEVLVMRDGKVVESGDADRILLQPREPYTRELVAALPALPGEAGRRPENNTNGLDRN